MKPLLAVGGGRLLNYLFGSNPNNTHFQDGLGLILGVAVVLFIFKRWFFKK
jgi:hypothetical protein